MKITKETNIVNEDIYCTDNKNCFDTQESCVYDECGDLSGTLIQAIKDEWETISYYNSVIENVERCKNCSFIIPVLEEIIGDENDHIVQLQGLLEKIAPSIGKINGREEESGSPNEDAVFADDDFGSRSGFDYFI